MLHLLNWYATFTLGAFNRHPEKGRHTIITLPNSLGAQERSPEQPSPEQPCSDTPHPFIRISNNFHRRFHYDATGSVLCLFSGADAAVSVLVSSGRCTVVEPAKSLDFALVGLRILSGSSLGIKLVPRLAPEFSMGSRLGCQDCNSCSASLRSCLASFSWANGRRSSPGTTGASSR